MKPERLESASLPLRSFHGRDARQDGRRSSLVGLVCAMANLIFRACMSALKQNIRRKGFVWGLFAGVLFIAYKVFKYPGSITRSDMLLCLAVVLSSGLAGGLVGLVLGAIFCSSDGKNGD